MSSKKGKGNAGRTTAPAKKSGTTASSAKQAPAKKTNNSKLPLIIGAVVVIVAVGFLILSGGGKGANEAGALTPTPEEAKYIGRFLPEGYVEPKIGDGGPVTADIPMTPVEAKVSEAGLSIPVSEVTSKRNVGFTYTKADGTPVAMIAFMKPSGKLSVAVSFCVPCKGTSHTMTTDGALTCDACGTKRDIETGVGISGACKLYPMDEMPVTVDGDNITIEKSVLENWTEQPTDRKVG